MFTKLLRKEHAERKRILARHFSRSSIQGSVDLQETCRSIVCVGLRDEVHKWAREDSTVDVLDKGRAVIMDLTTAWLVGPTHRTNLLQDHHAADELLTHFKQSFDGFFWRSEFWEVIEFARRLGIYFIPRTMYSSRLAIRRWSSETCEAVDKTSKDTAKIDEEANLKSSPPVYVMLREGLKGSGLSAAKLNDVASSEILDQMIASHDVAGIVLTYLLFELSKYPSVQQALRKELRAAFALDSTSFSRCFDNMPLLDAVLMETLRLHSANPGPWPRRTPMPSCQLGAYANIPAGTIVSATSYTLHRNSAVFPQPEEWLPQRWMDASEEQHKEMMRWFWPFGSGARMCIGSHFAIYSTLLCLT